MNRRLKHPVTNRLLTLLLVCAWSILGYAQANVVVHEPDIFGCENEILYWHCNYYTPAPGVYEVYDTIPATDGTDSVTFTRFRIYPTYRTDSVASICQGETFTWRNRDLTQAGFYADTLSTVNTGCDSIFTLTLSFLPGVPPDTIADTICYMGTYDWQGTHYDNLTPGLHTFTQRYTTIYDCESYHMLSLLVLPEPVLNDTTVFVCHGETFTWHGTTFSQPGTYDRFAKEQSVRGCDSVFYTMHFDFWPDYSYSEQITVTDAQLPYLWHDTLLTRTGAYVRVFNNVYGCDSVFHVQFAVTSSTSEAVTICHGESFLWNNRLLTTAGAYDTTLTSVLHGGDSTAHLVLNILPAPVTAPAQAHVLCPGDAYTLNGHVYSQAGSYIDTVSFLNFPCDSAYTPVTITFSDTTAVLHPLQSRMDTDPCYVWNGQSLCDPGIYNLYQPNTDGCPVRHSIPVQVFHVVDSTLHVVSDCSNDRYRFNFFGRDTTIILGVTTQMTYTMDVADPTVVDTIFHLSIPVTILHASDTYFYDTVTCGMPYVWEGFTYIYDSIGSYEEIRNYTNGYGCDSTVHLMLEVEKIQLKSVSSPELCPESGVDFLINYTTTQGVLAQRYSVRFSDEAKAQGFQDVLNLRTSDLLDYIIFPVHFGRDFFPAAGQYTATLYVTTGTQRDTAAMSRMDFTFNVLYPSWFAEQHWNDLLAVLSPEYTANRLNPSGYTFTAYQWYRNGQPIPDATSPMLYFAQSPLLMMGPDAWSADDDIQVLLTDSTGRSYFTCPFHMQLVNDRPVVHDTYFTARPTLVSRADSHTVVSCPESGMYAVFTVAGQLLMEGDLNAGSTTIELPRIPGTYLLHLKAGSASAYSNASTATLKIIVY